MKPVMLTAIVKIKDGDNEVKIEERPVCLHPMQIACVNRDKIKPFGQDKREGNIPIINANFDNTPIDCSRVTCTTKDTFAVRESVEEIFGIWSDAMSDGPSTPAAVSALQAATA